MTKKHITFRVIGQHEFYPHIKSDKSSDRKNRKKCIYYEAASKFCLKITADCVGPSICKNNYKECVEETNNDFKRVNGCNLKCRDCDLVNCAIKPAINMLVFNKADEVGRIISIKDRQCVISFSGRKVVCDFYVSIRSGFIRLCI